MQIRETSQLHSDSNDKHLVNFMWSFTQKDCNWGCQNMVKVYSDITLLHFPAFWYRSVRLIREFVDSLCRDGADAQYIYKKKPYNFTTNALKAHLCA